MTHWNEYINDNNAHLSTLSTATIDELLLTPNLILRSYQYDILCSIMSTGIQYSRSWLISVNKCIE